MPLSGNWFDYVLVFWGGVVVSFTPCVYPLIPITAGFIAGVNTKGGRLSSFLLSLIYVFGLALTYCLLGVFAALSGKIFGQIQNTPWVFLAVANILILFALMMFDVIPLSFIGLQLNKTVKVKNAWTVLLAGMTSGLIVGPCTAPILGTLLGYVASKKNVVHGVSLLFVFAYGVGASLILVGTFSGILAVLPKSGPWLVRVKQMCGVVFLIAAEYFLIKAGGLMI